MTITLTAPLTAPPNPVAVAIAGGTLPAARQYWFKVVAHTYTSYSPPYTDRTSPPSIEVTATTDAVNKTVRISWDAVAGAACYVVYVKWAGQAYVKIPAGLGYTTTLITYDWTSEVTGSNIDLLASTVSLPLDLPRETGLGIATVTGYETLDTIYAAIVAAYPDNVRKTAGMYVFHFNIVLTNTGALNVNTGVTVVLIQCHLRNTSASFTLTWYDASKWVISVWSEGVVSNYNLVFLGTVFLMGLVSIGVGTDPVIIGGDNWVIFDLAITALTNVFISGIPKAGVVNGKAMSVSFFGCEVYCYGTTQLENCTFTNGMIHATVPVGAFYWRDCTILGGWAWHGRWYFQITGIIPMYDCTFNPTYCEGGDPNKPWFMVNLDGAKLNTWGIYRSITGKVVDENGDPINGARVIIKDKNGSVVLDTIVGVDGLVAKTDLLVMDAVWASGTGASTILTYTAHYPFSIVVSKDGYRTYVSELASLSTKIYLLLALSADGGGAVGPVVVGVDAPTVIAATVPAVVEAEK